MIERSINKGEFVSKRDFSEEEWREVVFWVNSSVNQKCVYSPDGLETLMERAGNVDICICSVPSEEGSTILTYCFESVVSNSNYYTRLTKEDLFPENVPILKRTLNRLLSFLK